MSEGCSCAVLVLAAIGILLATAVLIDQAKAWQPGNATPPAFWAIIGAFGVGLVAIAMSGTRGRQ